MLAVSGFMSHTIGTLAWCARIFQQSMTAAYFHCCSYVGNADKAANHLLVLFHDVRFCCL